ncbi:uncharacterized protein [Henckelia pumila]|uniref:uncharacterized protein n=1 Tax=Henckelia pumila TaxID=405737 RepID=UPI003C6DF231
MSLRESQTESNHSPDSERYTEIELPVYSPSSGVGIVNLSNSVTLDVASASLQSLKPVDFNLEPDLGSSSESDSDGIPGETVSHPLSRESVSYVCRCKGIPRSCDIIVPCPGDSRHSPPAGFFTVYVEHLNSGFSIPPCPVLIGLIKSLGVSLSQLTPNALLYFFGFRHQVGAFELDPSLDLFHALFSARPTKPDSDIYFQPRPKCRFLRKLRSHRGAWKSDFFYAKDCGWGVPVDWSSGLTIIKNKGSILELQSQCRSLGLFNENFDPRCLVSAGNQIDLSKLRHRENKSGRPLPWSGPKHKGNGRDASDRVSESVPRAGVSRGVVPRGRQGHSIPSLPDERSSGAGAIDHRRGASKRPMEEGKKGGEVLPADPAKKLREASSSSVRKARPHPLLLDGVNRDGAESFWDSSDFEIGLRRGAKVVGDHDLNHLIPRSSSILRHSIALGSCQILSAVRALEAREDKAQADEAKILKELAKLKEDVVRLEASEVRAKEEILRLGGENSSIKEELRQWPEKLGVKEKEGETLRSELSALYERHYTEVQTGAGFLSSPPGLQLQRSLEERAVESFCASAAFEEEVFRRAYAIHDELILESRRILREQHVSENVVKMIGAGFPDPDMGPTDMPRVAAPLDDFGDFEIIEALNSLQGDDAPGVP